MNARLCVITAMRDCAPLVPMYTQMIDSFEVEPTRIVIGINDSTDDTENLLRRWHHPALDLIVFDLGAPSYSRIVPRDEVSRLARCKERSTHLAAVRNRVIKRALAHSDWDIALMQDASKMTSPDLPGLLMGEPSDIAAPMSWFCKIPARFYDTWCYRDAAGQPYGWFLPPDIFSDKRVPASSVGGVYTVKRRVFEAGCRLGGTDGRDCDSVPLCGQARQRGYSIIVRTDLGVTAYDYPDHTPCLGAMNAFLPAGDYVAKELAIIRPDRAFPHMIVGDPNQCSWQYLRRNIPHNWYNDERYPGIGFLNRDEVHILYNSALQFRGKRGLEIGCWLGWSACHLALAGLALDVVDPVLGNTDFQQAVQESLHAAGVLNAVNLISGMSPEKVEEMANGKKWSFFFIDGDHEGSNPLRDADVCERHAERDALAMFHDLSSPHVERGLDYFRAKGWNTMVYQTAQIMGVAWRGTAKPVGHHADARVQWPPLPSHLRGYPVSNIGR